jgi:hypothetical protein
MKVYRILVDSAKRQPGGHEYDFELDISGLATARDLKGHTWMAAVEWNDPVKYSELSPTFAKSAAHPAALFLTCPTLSQYNTWESWTGAPSSTISVLPGYAGYGYYGCSADAPYCRKKTLGAIIQGDRLNQAGTLRFRVMRDGDTTSPAVRPCLPVGAGASGGDFSFSLVFWQVSRLGPEQPLAPTYDFFKVFLRSADRSSGTAADCLIPVRLSTGGSMLSWAWQVAIEACGPLYHEGADLRGLVFFSQTFGDNNNGDGVIGHLPRSYRAGEDFHYGLRLTTRPAARDNIGYPVRTPIDNLSAVHIAVRNAATLAPIAAGLREWSACLYFYRVSM